MLFKDPLSASDNTQGRGRRAISLAAGVAMIAAAVGLSIAAPGIRDRAAAPINTKKDKAMTETTATSATTQAPAVTETATFAAGCFWGVEATFRKTPGVVRTAVGYTDGATDKPTYKQVCNGDSGHAEAVEVVYDPAKVGYDKLLEIFYENHDPTTMNRQGPDVGDQYRSAVYYHGDTQKAAAEAYTAKLTAAGRFRRPIVTQIRRAATFHVAEDYHQQYLEKRGMASCHTGVTH